MLDQRISLNMYKKLITIFYKISYLLQNCYLHFSSQIYTFGTNTLRGGSCYIYYSGEYSGEFSTILAKINIVQYSNVQNKF